MGTPSVVIRCGNDSRVLRCIRSVDTAAEIVVAFTGPSSLADQISSTGSIIVPVPSGNLSIVSNRGIEAAKGDRVVLTDSDTEFEPACIERLTSALARHKIARARLRFEHERGTFSRVVAEARDYVNGLPLVYTPGLAIRRDLIQDVGGFLFNNPVPYAVDADLDLRVKRAGVPVTFVKNAILRHAPIYLRHDIRAAHRIGRGCRISMEHWNRNGSLGEVNRLDLKGLKPNGLAGLLRRKGPAVLAYQLVWDASYWIGFLRQGRAE